jgi:hypothetical protein
MPTPFTHPDDYEVLPKQYRILERGGRTVVAAMMPYPDLDSGAKCAGDEAFGEELARVGTGQIAYMKGKCAACPLLTACREWGIAHEQYLMFGGLTPGERKAIRKQRGQVCVEPSAAHEYGMADEYIQLRGLSVKGIDPWAHTRDGYAADLPWGEPDGEG